MDTFEDIQREKRAEEGKPVVTLIRYEDLVGDPMTAGLQLVRQCIKI